MWTQFSASEASNSDKNWNRKDKLWDCVGLTPDLTEGKPRHRVCSARIRQAQVLRKIQQSWNWDPAKKPLLCHRMIEIGCVLWKSPCSILLFEQGQLERVTQDHVQWVSNISKDGYFITSLEQPVPVFVSPHRRKSIFVCFNLCLLTLILSLCLLRFCLVISTGYVCTGWAGLTWVLQELCLLIKPQRCPKLYWIKKTECCLQCPVFWIAMQRAETGRIMPLRLS